MTLDRRDLTAASAPLAHARAMPAGFHTDPAIFAAERERIFLRDWFFLCRDDMLPGPGDCRTFDPPGGPVVALRGADGQARVFANCCRHRGSILLEGAGNCGGRVTCPYHGWS